MLTTSRLKTASLVFNTSRLGFVSTKRLFGAGPLTMHENEQAGPVETAIKQKVRPVYYSLQLGLELWRLIVIEDDRFTESIFLDDHE